MVTAPRLLLAATVSQSISGRLRLTWSSSCTGTLWPLRSCSMSCDALLQLGAPRLELLHFCAAAICSRAASCCAAAISASSRAAVGR